MSEKDVVELKFKMQELEKDMSVATKRIGDTEKRLQYYDKMALKAGFFSMGFLCFGAALAMGFDKLKDKIIHWILP